MLKRWREILGYFGGLVAGLTLGDATDKALLYMSTPTVSPSQLAVLVLSEMPMSVLGAIPFTLICLTGMRYFRGAATARALFVFGLVVSVAMAVAVFGLGALGLGPVYVFSWPELIYLSLASFLAGGYPWRKRP